MSITPKDCVNSVWGGRRRDAIIGGNQVISSLLRILNLEREPTLARTDGMGEIKTEMNLPDDQHH